MRISDWSSDVCSSDLKLDHLKVSGGVLALDATGQWRRVNGKSSGRVQATADSDDFEAVLRALDYEQNFRAKKTHVKADLKWAPSPAGLRWQQTNGRVDLESEDDQLRSEEHTSELQSLMRI